MHKIRWLGVLVLAVVVALVANGPPARTQEGSEIAGICDGAICGPSGAFSPATFPTLTSIDWSAFPTARRWTWDRGSANPDAGGAEAVTER